MDAITISVDRLHRLDSTTRAVLALMTAGITGGGLRDADRDPLDVHEALAVVTALTAAGVPPMAVDDDGFPVCVTWGALGGDTFK